jgi:hypothetical protein
MSGYWDAIDREARALPAVAQPRPRSIFEGDASAADDAAPFVLFAEVDTETAPASEPAETRTPESAARQSLSEPSAASPPSGEARPQAPIVALPPAAPSQQPVIGPAPAPATTDAGALASQPAQPRRPTSPEQESRPGQLTVPPTAETRTPVLAQAVERAAESELPTPAPRDAEHPEPPPPVGVAAQAMPETVVAQPIVAAPRDAAEAPAESADPALHEPSLTIEIGEIHIRIAAEHEVASPVLLRPARAPAAPPLDSFLQRSGEARR